MSAGGWVALAALVVILLVLVGMHVHRLLAGEPNEREQVLQSQVDALKAANYLGQEFFRAQAAMRDPVVQGRASVPYIDGEAVVRDPHSQPPPSRR